MCGDIKLDNLAPSLSEKCDEEFQRQVKATDGEFFVYFDQEFEGISLIKPSTSAQIIAANFANSGCPVNGLRFGNSLLRFTDEKWPISAHTAGLRYILSSIEILLNLKLDNRKISSIEVFESSVEFKKLIHIADYVAQHYCLTENICFDVLAYINFHARLVPMTLGEQ
jgi:hypothetical protein